ncbi:MAG: acetyl-CoA C-acetyltransferase [Aquificaceae bacterium]|nr:MAG: acetyl-CoA C-acetyltransferase [Aquificaceae bacterium]
MTNSTARPVYLIDGARTPFLKARGKLGLFSASDLSISASNSLMLRQPFAAQDLDEVIYGCVMPSPDETNIARIIALRIGGGHQLTAHTVQRNCASGLQAIDSACRNIAHGYSNLVLAGGVDAMSRAPLLLKEDMVHWLANWSRAKTASAKLKALGALRGHYFAPIISLLRGLRDPVVGLNMGQTAEELAWRFGISRTQMDELSVQSHLRLASAIEHHHLDEITPVYSPTGKAFTQDDGVRADSSVEKLATLKPFFDKPYGSVTPANSSQITDGACSVILASEEAIQQYHLPVLAKLNPAQWAGVDPSQMGLGPANAITETLKTHNLSLDNIDYWELNEAFAAQVQACVIALNDADYCQHDLGLDDVLGEIPNDKLNIDGGAISLGHPVGASGARIVLHLAKILQRKHASKGIASLCIGGGQGGAMLVEAVK